MVYRISVHLFAEPIEFTIALFLMCASRRFSNMEIVKDDFNNLDGHIKLGVVVLGISIVASPSIMSTDLRVVYSVVVVVVCGSSHYSLWITEENNSIGRSIVGCPN